MFETISVKEVDQYIEDNTKMIIDLREPEDYCEMHIRNAVNIPYEKLMNNINLVPYNKHLVLYCERGSTSMRAARWLSDQGYNAMTVIGGIHAYRGINLVYGKLN